MQNERGLDVAIFHRLWLKEWRHSVGVNSSPYPFNDLVGVNPWYIVVVSFLWHDGAVQKCSLMVQLLDLLVHCDSFMAWWSCSQFPWAFDAENTPFFTQTVFIAYVIALVLSLLVWALVLRCFGCYRLLSSSRNKMAVNQLFFIPFAHFQTLPYFKDTGTTALSAVAGSNSLFPVLQSVP